MILVCESDVGTVVAAPRLNAVGDQVVLDVFTDGERTDSEAHQLADWPNRLTNMVAAGWLEDDGLPDLKVVLDTTTRTLRIAGSIDNSLIDPATGTDEDSVDSLVDQADDMLATAGADHGYLRVSNWWNDGNGVLTAVMIPRRPTEVEPEVQAAVRWPLNRALRAIRSQLVPLAGPWAVTTWAKLCGDPLADGFDVVVRNLMSDGLPAGVDPGVATGLAALYRALCHARAGDAAGAVHQVDQVMVLLTGRMR